MPPQFFENLENRRFAEAEAKRIGPYFQGRYLGRSLARLDWNQDGREDVVISHLDAPLALLTNRTDGTGHFLSVRLVGVASNRDAIGTIVTARIGERPLVRQLTAGDGYQASCERRLTFGLGDAGRVDELHVQWPSGKEQTFHDVPADVAVLVIEGQPPWLASGPPRAVRAATGARRGRRSSREHRAHHPAHAGL